jgi:hypothetical protein
MEKREGTFLQAPTLPSHFWLPPLPSHFYPFCFKRFLLIFYFSQAEKEKINKEKKNHKEEKI